MNEQDIALLDGLAFNIYFRKTKKGRENALFKFWNALYSMGEKK